MSSAEVVTDALRVEETFSDNKEGKYKSRDLGRSSEGGADRHVYICTIVSVRGLRCPLTESLATRESINLDKRFRCY